MITANRMLEIMKERDIVVRKHPDGTGWLPETSKGSRLGGRRKNPFATPEEAVEAAEQHLIEMEIRETESRASRLFDVLAVGAFWAKSRLEPGNPEGRIWDIFDGNDAPLVTGERSLRAAIIAAEVALAPKGNPK